MPDIDQTGNCCETEAGGMSYKDRIGAALWSMSNEHSPLDPVVLQQQVDETVPPSGLRSTGLTACLEPLREWLAECCHRKDLGLIPKTGSYCNDTQCCAAHAGFCKANATPTIIAINKRLCSLMSKWRGGTRFQLRHGANIDELQRVQYCLALDDIPEKVVVVKVFQRANTVQI